MKIVVALSKTENGAALFTRMQVVEDVTGGTLQQVVDEAVAPGSKIECDGYRFNRRKIGDQILHASDKSRRCILCTAALSR